MNPNGPREHLLKANLKKQKMSHAGMESTEMGDNLRMDFTALRVGPVKLWHMCSYFPAGPVADIANQLQQVLFATYMWPMILYSVI